MWKATKRLFGKLSTKWKIVSVLLISLLLVITFAIAKKVIYIALIISAAVVISIVVGKISNKFKKSEA